MNADSNDVINELLEEIKNLNKDKALYAAVIKSLNAKIEDLERSEKEVEK